jgi:hypothetical protein
MIIFLLCDKVNVHQLALALLVVQQEVLFAVNE